MLSLFYVFPPSHLSLFLSPSCPSHLPICVGGEQLGTGKACSNMKPLFQYHKSYKWWTKNRLLLENSFICLQNAAFSILWYFSFCYIWLESFRVEISGENDRLVCDTLLFDMEKYWTFFFFLLAFYDSTLSITYRIHLYKSEWVFSKSNCLRPFENRHFKIFLNKSSTMPKRILHL